MKYTEFEATAYMLGRVPSWQTTVLIWLMLLACTPVVWGQTNFSPAYTFTTLAGKVGVGSSDGVGNNAQFYFPVGVARDTSGNLYVADSANQTIREVTPAGVVSTIAGFPGAFGNVDGTGSNARFRQPTGVAVDSAGNVYVADSFNSSIRKLTSVGTNWVVTTIASNNGTTTFAQPTSIAVDSSGNLYVSDISIQYLIKITRVGNNWVASRFAGQPFIGGNQDGTNFATFEDPYALCVDSIGNVYVADPTASTIRKVTPSGVVSTIGGQALSSPGDIDGPGSSSKFNGPNGIAVDGAGNLYVADTYNVSIRKLVPNGTAWTVSTFAGSVTNAGIADGTGLNAQFGHPLGITSDATGNLFVTDQNEIRTVSSASVVNTLAGSAAIVGSTDGTGNNARFDNPKGVAADSAGNIYVADAINQTIRKITSAGVVNTIAGYAGHAGSADGAGNIARFNNPAGIAIDSAGNLYVSDWGNNTIRKVTPAGLVSTLAGLAGSSGTADGLAGNARFNGPNGIAVDKSGDLFVSDANSATIREITPGGQVSTIASNALGIAVDSLTNLYVAAPLFSTYLISKLKFTGSNWAANAIAGSTQGYKDGTGNSAKFNTPVSLAVDKTGNVFVLDDGNNNIRELVNTGTNWTVGTVAGNPYFGSGPSGVPYGSADGIGINVGFHFSDYSSIAVDSAGNVYVTDTVNNTIRKGVFQQYGQANPTPYVAPVMSGQLTVVLNPPNANGQWHFPWEQGWHNSGDTVSNLVAGNYAAQFRSIPGWLAYPSSLTVVLTNNSTTVITNQYVPTAGANTNNGAGTLVVNLGVNPPPGAGWRFIGDNGAYLPSGYSTNLATGNYLIEFAAVNGRGKPGSLSVPITAGQPTYVNVSYLLAGSAPANVYLPFPVPLSNVTNVTQYPFGYCGQLQSDVGYGSGAAVSTNVVLTVAHLVFDDQTLNYVSQVYWFVQREAGLSEPLPQAARGWYVLSGYAAQRTNDLNSGYAPDQSTPTSRNLDVAALYFLSPVAGGGEGGYLPSDAVPNTWLTSTALKMLVGYPVDGSLFGTNVVAGQMYQTDPQPFPLTIDPNSVPGQQEVYQAPWFFSYPGNSGGPFYVQLNGYYYPAGVYLGTLYSGSTPTASLIRAIDSQVVNLITNAQTLGDAGTNSTGGGVTVLSSQVATGTAGYMQWQLGPPSALTAGAAWQLTNDNSFSTATNYTAVISTTNPVTVRFKPLPGWQTPTNQRVSVPSGFITVFGLNYTVSNPVLTFNPATGLGFSGTTGTVYRLEVRTNLISGNWQTVRTNTITNSAFNLLLPKSAFTNRNGFYRAVWLP